MSSPVRHSLWQELTLDRSADTPLTRQLAAALRALVASGTLMAGERLPPTRELAAQLRLSRGTVTEVFETLCAEGYLEARVGAGTFVRALPETRQTMSQPSARAQALMALELPERHSGPPRPFGHSRPDARLFPWKIWARLEAEAAPPPHSGEQRPISAAGWLPLREQVAAYLRQERGLDCRPEQVIITSGTQQALDLAARTLLDSGEVAGLESPGYLGTRAALLSAGLALHPLRVDEGGLDTAALWRVPELRLVGCTPAHQFPSGAVLSPERRLELIRWAEERSSWILEDDYDSEYRYAGPPLTPLQALSHRVIHLGSFSAFLFSGLRLGFLVVPLPLVSAFTAVKAALDRGSPRRDSMTLARFMKAGHFARHLTRTRRAYAARHDLLLSEVLRLGANVPHTGRGLHLTVQWPQQAALLRQAQLQGLDVAPVSAYGWSHKLAHGVLMGFAAHTESELLAAVQRLSSAD